MLIRFRRSLIISINKNSKLNKHNRKNINLRLELLRFKNNSNLKRAQVKDKKRQLVMKKNK